MAFKWNLRDGKELKTGIGFETFLLEKGFMVHYNGECNSFNTYDHCARAYKKDNIAITIGLMDTPCRIGITHPYIVLCDDEGKDYYNYTYAPSESQYEHFLNVLSYIEEPKYKQQ